MSERTILVWFRNDLRIHDNEVLTEACRKGSRVLPVYCFDPRYFSKTPYGTLKTGFLRAQFLLESVADLKASLQRKGGGLLVLHGKPEELLPKTAEEYQADEVYHHREVAAEETEVSALVEAALWKKQINLKHFIGHTLYHKEDLPFPIKNIPDAFPVFRKKIERESEVRPSFIQPEVIRVPDNMPQGALPSMEELGFAASEKARFSVDFKGGETEGLESMKHFFEETDWLNLKNSRKIAGPELSSKLSAWLSLGCLSAREVYWAVKQAEEKYGAAALPFLLQLLWRDYFRFMFKKHENRFSPKGFFDTEIVKLDPGQQQLFDDWKNAQTKVPLVDACMLELNQTGYIHHKKRQLAASYLVNVLSKQWAYGASYFEERLIDHSPASNWGNWALAAGLGGDTQQKQQYDVLKKELALNPTGVFVSSWVPGSENAEGKEHCTA